MPVTPLIPETVARLLHAFALRLRRNGGQCWSECWWNQWKVPRRPEYGGLVPLSFGQQRLWFMAQLDPDSSVYNTVTCAPLPDPVDLDALQCAVDAMVERHESLRTTFNATDGEPVARLSARVTVLVEVNVQPAALAQRPFDLERGPLLRVGALLDQGLVMVCIHHIITDGWSMRIFLREFWALYAARTRGELARLPPLPVSYADYAAWQRRELSGTRLRMLLEFWRAELAEFTDFRPADGSSATASAQFSGQQLAGRYPTRADRGITSLGARARSHAVHGSS